MMVDFKMYTTFLAFIAILYSTKAQSLDELCVTNGKLKAARYFKHPTDCDKFIQCNPDDSQRFAYVRQCPFPTYWNTDLLTCVSVQKVMCSTDKCTGKPDGFVFEGYGNCRGYWECQDEISEPKCCPLGQRFNLTEAGCVETNDDDDECKDSCMGIVYKSQNQTSNKTVVCKKTAVSGSPSVYEQYQLGWGLRQYQCAPGTVFDQDTCECIISAAAPAKKAKCKPDVHLTFTSNQTIRNGYYVENSDNSVLVKNGVAEFNGVDSRLSIPRFNNIEHIKSVVIRIKYKSLQEKSMYPQAILSNSGCGFIPSILIEEDENVVIFRVGTTKIPMVSISVPQPTDIILPTEKTIELKFLDGVLIGSVNDVTSSIPADGYLRNVHCTLNVGFAENMSRFKGEINELSVFLCDPEM